MQHAQDRALTRHGAPGWSIENDFNARVNIAMVSLEKVPVEFAKAPSRVHALGSLTARGGTKYEARVCQAGPCNLSRTRRGIFLMLKLASSGRYDGRADGAELACCIATALVDLAGTFGAETKTTRLAKLMELGLIDKQLNLAVGLGCSQLPAAADTKGFGGGGWSHEACVNGGRNNGGRMIEPLVEAAARLGKALPSDVSCTTAAAERAAWARENRGNVPAAARYAAHCDAMRMIEPLVVELEAAQRPPVSADAQLAGVRL